MNRRSLGVVAAILVLLMVIVATAGLDNLPRELRKSIDSAQTKLVSDRAAIDKDREFLDKAVRDEPTLFRTRAGEWQSRIAEDRRRLDTAAAAELATLQQLAKANRRRDAEKVEAELRRFESLRQDPVKDAAALRSEAERWIQYKRDLPKRVEAMRASYEGVQSTDLDLASAPVIKAMTDWPAKKDDLQSRLEALKRQKAAAEKIWNDTASQRAEAESGKLDNFDYGAFFAAGDHLDAAARELKQEFESLNTLAAQLYTSWDKVLVDAGDDRGSYREKFRFVKTKYPDATLANGHTSSDEKWEPVDRAALQTGREGTRHDGGAQGRRQVRFRSRARRAAPGIRLRRSSRTVQRVRFVVGRRLALAAAVPDPQPVAAHVAPADHTLRLRRVLGRAPVRRHLLRPARRVSSELAERSPLPLVLGRRRVPVGRFRTVGFLRQQPWKADRRMVHGTPEIVGKQGIRRIVLSEPRRVRRIEVPVPRWLVRIARDPLDRAASVDARSAAEAAVDARDVEGIGPLDYESIALPLAHVILGVIVLILAKYALQLLSPYALDQEMTTKDNPAFGLAVSGYYAGVVLIYIAAALAAGPLPTDSGPRGVLVALASDLAYALCGVLALNASRWVFDRVLVSHVRNDTEIAANRNTGAGALECGGYLASAIVLGGGNPSTRRERMGRGSAFCARADCASAGRPLVPVARRL